MKIIYDSAAEEAFGRLARPGVTFIMPNRKWIARGKKAVAGGVGFLGVNFFTFDDLLADLAMMAPRNQWRAVYVFRRLLAEGDTVFSTLRTMEKVRRLFQWCDQMAYLSVYEEDLPYTWRKETPRLLSLYKEAVDATDCITEGMVFREAMDAEVYRKGDYVVMGFTHFAERHRLLLEKLDEVCTVTAIYPASGEAEMPKGLSQVTAYETLDGERALRHMVKKVTETLTETPDASIGVVLRDGGDRKAAVEHLQAVGVTVASTRYKMTEEALYELRLLWRRGDDVASACAYLRQKEASVDGGRVLADALESLHAETLDEVDFYHLPCDLSEEKKDLLVANKAMLEKWHKEARDSWEVFARRTEESARMFQEEDAQVVGEALAATYGDYGILSGEEFESILLDPMEKEATGGVEVSSLDEAYGGTYDLFLFASSDGGAKREKKEDSLMNRSLAKEVAAAGLYRDFFQGDDETARLIHLMEAAKKSAIYKVGDGEAAPFFSSVKNAYPSVNLDVAGEVYERAWDLETAEEDFSEESAAAQKVALVEKGISPSAVDAYLRCPFRYFAENVLGLFSPEEEGRVAMAKGSLYHRAMERYFSDRLRKDDLRAFVEEGYDEKIRDVRPPYLREWEKKEMAQALLAAVESEEGRLADEGKNGAYRPIAFETAFTYPFHGVAIHGVIDRVDKNSEGEEVLIDYKSKGLPEYKDVADYKVMQLSLYALARRYMGNRPASLEYVSVEEARASVMVRDTDRAGGYKGLKKERKYDGDAFDRFLEGAEDALAAVLEQIRRGHFPPMPAKETHCVYCPFGDLCRKEKHRDTAG
ncbi:MAG: PD-(D/E)XK nuclease family protein [Peptoniphilus sp.]|nr:PD-(D/E)XK nuclease family protein [Peptoniphilus sp.]MDY3118737.1 PD-(D/E)XK nuclease family protein [Peptoniphilus sp.]